MAKRVARPVLPELTWRSFVAPGTEGVVDVARDGKTLYVRTASGLEVRRFVSEEAAIKNEAARVDGLTNAGWAPNGTKLEKSTEPWKPERPQQVTISFRAEGRKAFDQHLPRFVAALSDAGIHPLRKFEEQAAPGRHPNDVARDCLRLAEQIFDVRYAHRVRDHDDHGRPGPVGRSSAAAFFVWPVRVAMIACLKLQDRLRTTDGDYGDDPEYYGLDLEIEARIEELLASGRR